MANTVKRVQPRFDTEVSLERLGDFTVASELGGWMNFFDAYRNAVARGGVPTTAELETALYAFNPAQNGVVEPSRGIWTSSLGLHLFDGSGWQFGVSHELDSDKNLYENLLDAFEAQSKEGRRWTDDPKNGIGKLVVESVKDTTGFTPTATEWPHIVASNALHEDPIASRIHGKYAREFGERLAWNGIAQQRHYVLTNEQLRGESPGRLVVCPVGLGLVSDLYGVNGGYVYEDEGRCRAVARAATSFAEVSVHGTR